MELVTFWLLGLTVGAGLSLLWLMSTAGLVPVFIPIVLTFLTFVATFLIGNFS